MKNKIPRLLLKAHLVGFFILTLSLYSHAQTDCTDTIEYSRFYSANGYSFSHHRILAQKSGSTLILGKMGTTPNGMSEPFISKLINGKVIWNKRIINVNLDSTILFKDALELKDGSIIIYAVCNPSNETYFFKHILIRLDSSGNLKTSEAFTTKELSSSVDNIHNGYLHAMADGNLGLLLHISSNYSGLILALQLNPDFTISWSKEFYSITDPYYPVGISSTHNSLVVAGMYQNNTGICNQEEKVGSHIMKINLSDGILLTERSYCQSLPEIPVKNYGFGSWYSSFIKSKNKNFRLLTAYNGTRKNGIVTYLSFDTLLNVTKSKLVASKNGNHLGSNHYSINSDGALAITYLGQREEDLNFIAIDSNYQMLQQKKLRVSTVSRTFQSPWTFMPSLDDKNDLVLFFSKNNNGIIENESMKTNLYRNDSTCIGTETELANIEDMTMNASDWTLSQGKTDIVKQISFVIHFSDIVVHKEIICQMILAPPVLNAGEDVIKCIYDTLSIRATPGYSNYTWYSGNNLLNLNDSVISVHDNKPATYSVFTEPFPGCKIIDSISVSIYTPTPINLGNDTSFCKGLSVELNAGGEFKKYLWSNDSTSQIINVKNPGIYFVKAMDNNGCFSKDTILINDFLPAPDFSISDKTILCSGQNDTLSPGKDNSTYTWQNGSTNNFMPVTEPGKYWVTVTNEFNCQKTDTVLISDLHKAPQNFIISDTTICIGKEISLSPNRNFRDYLWSTGSTSPVIKVKDPGNYSLRVMDQNGCYGEEVILVRTKECFNKFFMPSAFSPNNDGINDVFKPFVEGNLLKYELVIYNRWGQVVFKTNNHLTGWKGSYDSKD